MAEPRMRARTKGQQFSTADLESFLIGFGSAGREPALPSTLTALDSIITDFIIETCHAAAQTAAYSHRQKIKVEDFKFALRHSPAHLGRVVELLAINKDIQRERKAFNMDEEEAAARAGALEATEKAGKRGRKRIERGAEEDGGGAGRSDGEGGDGRKKKRKKPGRKKKDRSLVE